MLLRKAFFKNPDENTSACLDTPATGDEHESEIQIYKLAGDKKGMHTNGLIEPQRPVPHVNKSGYVEWSSDYIEIEIKGYKLTHANINASNKDAIEIYLRVR